MPRHRGDVKGHWKVVSTTEFGQAPCWSVMSIHPDIDEGPIEALKEIFPDGEANEMNFVLFSTSGIAGSYCSLETIEASIEKYGDKIFDEEVEEIPDDWTHPCLTFVLIQPRIIGIRYGNVLVTKEDIPYLKKLRQTSWDVVSVIGTG